MGMRVEHIDYLWIAQQYLKKDWGHIRVCELGNQHIRLKSFSNKEKVRYNLNQNHTTGKKYISSLGVREHVSLDINGRDGSIKKDLRKPIKQWLNYFDIVTDFGTSEHVNPIYMCFKNIHDITKVDGLMIHINPVVDEWKGHGAYHYKEDFPDNFCFFSHYNLIVVEHKIISSLKDKKLLFWIAEKTKESIIVPETIFYQLGTIKDGKK